MGDVREITFRVDPGESPDWPCVTVLVDGIDLIGEATAYKGFDPGQLFGSDAPLLPRQPSRRVAIYRCSCGEPGCGCAACVIEESAGRVHWSDFRDFVGVYSRPTVSSDPSGGRKHAVPNLTFDGAQYRAEVARAAADRSWETRSRRLARLLRERIAARESELSPHGRRLGWVAPVWRDEARFTVVLSAGGRQIVVQVHAALDEPDDTAVAQMCDAFFSPSAGWYPEA